MPAASGVKRIFVVEVRNSGKKEILQTYIQLGLASGELSEIATEASPGVKLKEEKESRQVALTADLLNPGDFVKVSFLTALSSPDVEPRVTVRAPGVMATDASKGGGRLLFDKDSKGLPLLLLVTGLAAVLSSFLLLSFFTRRLGGFSLSERLNQTEIAAFVCGTCSLFDEADQLRFGGPEITYRGTADYLLHRAKRAGLTERRRYEIALMALLLNKGLTDTAVKSIRSSAEETRGSAISVTEFESLQALATPEEKDPIEWRRTVVAYVQEAELRER